jgi:hypothetical protein
MMSALFPKLFAHGIYLRLKVLCSSRIFTQQAINASQSWQFGAPPRRWESEM